MTVNQQDKSNHSYKFKRFIVKHSTFLNIVDSDNINISLNQLTEKQESQTINSQKLRICLINQVY